MSEPVNQVCPIIPAPTDMEVRRMVAKPILDMAYEHGLERAGKTLGCSSKTISRARDQETTLSADTLISLIWNSPAFKDAVLAKIGERAVPVAAKCDTDVMPSLAGSVHKIALARTENSENGPDIGRIELKDMLPELIKARDGIDMLITKAREWGLVA